MVAPEIAPPDDHGQVGRRVRERRAWGRVPVGGFFTLSASVDGAAKPLYWRCVLCWWHEVVGWRARVVSSANMNEDK